MASRICPDGAWAEQGANYILISFACVHEMAEVLKFLQQSFPTIEKQALNLIPAKWKTITNVSKIDQTKDQAKRNESQIWVQLESSEQIRVTKRDGVPWLAHGHKSANDLQENEGSLGHAPAKSEFYDSGLTIRQILTPPN